MTELRRSVPLLAAGAGLTILFLSRFAPARTLLASLAVPAIVAIAVLLASLCAGVVALRLAARENDVPLLDALLIGYPAFGTLVAAFAWSGLSIDWGTAAMTIALAAFGAFVLLRTADRQLPAVHWLFALPIAIAFALAILPASSPDEMIYKLAVPHTYRMFGRMLELPLHSNSYITLAPHFTDLAAMVLGGGTAAKLARFGVFVAVLATVLRRGGLRPPELGGVLLALILAFTPALLLIAGWAWDEWLVIGLLVLSIVRFEQWLDERRTLHYVVAFAALGAAMASKYTALPWLAAFGVVALLRARKELLRGALLVVLFGGFFYLRNAIWTGSPVAPLLLPDAPQVMNYKSGGESLSGFREFFRGADVFDRDLVDESLGILLPLAALASLLALRRRERHIRDLLILGAIQLPLLLAIAPGSRNIVNGFVALAIPGCIVIAETWRNAARATRIALASFAAIAVAAQLVLVVFVIESYEPLRYLSGRESATQYLARMHDFMRPFAFVESFTSADARILFLGETQSLHLERQVLSGGNLDGPRIAAWLARFPSVDALHGEFRARGVSHVLMRKSRYRVASPSARPLSMTEREYMLEVAPRTHATLTELLKTRAVLRYRDADYLVFELR